MPALGDAFLGKIKPPTKTVDIQRELTARGITGWLHKNDGGEQSTADLRALLPVDSEGYLTTPPHTNFEPDQELLEDITLDDLSSGSDEDEML